jgi:hypothetical protein
MSASIELGWNNGKLQAGAAGAAAIVDKASRQMKGALSGIGSGLGGSLGITPFLGIAGAVGGAVVALKGLNDEYDHIWDVSQRLNESPESIQRIGLQAKLAGTDLDATAKAIQKMNLELRKGADSEGVKALKIMGVDAADFIKLSPEKQIAALAAAFQKAQASGVGFVEVQTLLGKKFSDLLPLLRASAAELDAMSKTKVVSNEDVEAIAKANDQWDKLKHTLATGTTVAFVGLINKLQLVKNAMDATDTSGWTSISMWASFTEQLKIAKDIQEKDAKAAEMVSEKLRQQQRDLDAITAAQSAANAQADESIKKSKDQAAAIDKVSKAYEEQARKANDAREALRNARDQTRDEYTTPEKKLEESKERILAIDKQIDEIMANGGDNEKVNKLLIEQEQEKRRIVQLGKEILSNQERINEENAKEAERVAQIRADYATNLQMLDLELAILNAQASGHDKKAKQLEHERDVQEETARIVADTGLAYADAAKKAEQLVSAKEKVDGRKDGNGRRKIHGYSQDQGDGVDTIGAGFRRAESRRNDARERANSRVNEFMGMDSMSPSRLAPRSDIGAKTPATDAPKASGESELATLFKAYSDKTVEIFEKALA